MPNYVLALLFQEYELAATGTLQKNFNLHTNREDASCKIVLSIYTGRQNRQDVTVDGSLKLATNSFLESDGSIGFEIQDPAIHSVSLTDPVGTNFFDRRRQVTCSYY